MPLLCSASQGTCPLSAALLLACVPAEKKGCSVCVSARAGVHEGPCAVQMVPFSACTQTALPARFCAHKHAALCARASFCKQTHPRAFCAHMCADWMARAYRDSRHTCRWCVCVFVHAGASAWAWAAAGACCWVVGLPMILRTGTAEVLGAPKALCGGGAVQVLCLLWLLCCISSSC